LRKRPGLFRVPAAPSWWSPYRLKIIYAVASLEVRCVYIVPSVEDERSGHGYGWVVAPVRGVGETTRNVDEAMEKIVKMASRKGRALVVVGGRRLRKGGFAAPNQLIHIGRTIPAP